MLNRNVLFNTAIVLIVFATTVTSKIHAQAFSRKPFLQSGSPTSAMICWRLKIAASLTVKYGKVADALDLTSAPSAVGTDGSVTLSGLSPSTKYFYKVYDGSTLLPGSTDQFFVTSPPPGTKGKYTFWLIGDAGTTSIGHGGEQNAVRDAFISVNKGTHTDGLIMLGDNAYNSGTDAEMTSDIYNIYPEIMANTFTWATIGNHESDAGGQTHVDAWYFPTKGECGGVASGSERFFSYDYGNVHFINLDNFKESSAKTGAQYIWLEKDLQATKADWIVAYFHYPPYAGNTGSKPDDNPDVYANFVDARTVYTPLLENYGVDFIYSGHVHEYSRTYLIDKAIGKFSENQANFAKVVLDSKSGDPRKNESYKKASANGPHEGTIAIVDGASGHLEPVQTANPMNYIHKGTLGSVILEFNNLTATSTYYDDKGAILDVVQVVQGAGTTGELSKKRDKQVSHFTYSGRDFNFPPTNTSEFKIYSSDGSLVFHKTITGSWTASKSEFPTGKYFYRHASSYGKLVFP